MHFRKMSEIGKGRLLKVATFLLTTLLVWQAHTIYQGVVPEGEMTDLHKGKAILYATSWCGFCDKARKLLKSHSIPYFEYDIEESLEGKRQMDELGGEAVPVLLINGQVVKGYQPDEILLLAKDL
jgi:glutaredoxin